MAFQDFYLPPEQAIQLFLYRTGRLPTRIVVHPAELPDGIGRETTAVRGIPVERCRAIPRGAVRLALEDDNLADAPSAAPAGIAAGAPPTPAGL